MGKWECTTKFNDNTLPKCDSHQMAQASTLDAIERSNKPQHNNKMRSSSKCLQNLPYQHECPQQYMAT